MSKIVYTRQISTAAVREACFIPEKMEPVVDGALAVMFATLIGEECNAVRENTTDLGMVNTTEIKNLFRQHHIAIFAALGLSDPQLPNFQINILNF
jgi:hypothetical protein